MQVLFHSCGAIRNIIPDLIEIGLDILYPIQTRAAGMEPGRLKTDFGDRLTFYGGVDTQWTMPYSTPDDVRREVRERIEVLGRGGGYIVSTTHVLMNDVPPENVVALYEEATRGQ
jgi:uroporphyrinogen decarboxylase